MEYKVFNRGNILVKLYKMFTKNNKMLSIQITEQVDYEHLRSTLNNFLREDQEITPEEILLINRGRDPLLTFIVLLALGLGLHLISKEEARRIFISLPDMVIAPTAYKKLTENHNDINSTTDVSYFDAIHTFDSGIKTLIPKQLLEEIKETLSEITKMKRNVLPPPKVKNEQLERKSLELTRSPHKSSIMSFIQSKLNYRKHTLA